MGFRVDGSESLLADVCVALRGSHVSMTKQILYHTQVCPTIEQVRGEAVAERVRMRWALAAAIEDATHIAARAGGRASLPNTASARSRPPRPPAERPARRASASTAGALSGTRRSFEPLAPDRDCRACEIDCVDVETAQFADAYAAAVQHFEHRVVAPSSPRWFGVGAGTSEERRAARDLGVLEDPR